MAKAALKRKHFIGLQVPCPEADRPDARAETESLDVHMCSQPAAGSTDTGPGRGF